MAKSVILVLCVALTHWGIVSCLSSGAPAGACMTLSPSPAPTAHDADPQTTMVPYEVDLSNFINDENGTYYYRPGETYESECDYSTYTLRGT